MAIDFGVGHFVGGTVGVDDAVGPSASIVVHDFTLEKCAIMCFVNDGTSRKGCNLWRTAAGLWAVDDVFSINPGFMKVLA